MSDYTRVHNFTAKDALPTGNANKKILGSQVDADFDAAATAIATKFDKAGGTITGTTTVSTGNIVASTGHIIATARPAFLAYLTSSVVAGQTIVFDNDSTDDAFDNGTNYNAATGQFTAPVAGIYSFQTMVFGEDLATALEVYFDKNGNTVGYLYDAARAAGLRSVVFGSITLKLSANDVVTVYSYAAGAYGTATRGLGSYFSGALIG